MGSIITVLKHLTWSYKTEKDTKLGRHQRDGAERSGDGSNYINSYKPYRILRYIIKLRKTKETVIK